HCFRNLIGLIKEETQVVVRHPASWISYKRCPPKRFNVTVHRALPPSQHRQHHNNAERRAKDQFTASFERASQSGHPCRRQRDRPDAGKILVMVGDKGVAKWEKHDETEDWAECREEKCCCDLDTAPQTAPPKVDHRT